MAIRHIIESNNDLTTHFPANINLMISKSKNTRRLVGAERSRGYLRFALSHTILEELYNGPLKFPIESGNNEANYVTSLERIIFNVYHLKGLEFR